MRFVILAAGKSSRIYKKIGKIKCLLKIKKKSLISRAIIELKKADRKAKITVVTGFQSNMIKKELFKFKEVNYIYNRKFLNTDMLHSFYLALKKYNDDLFFCYSDIIFSHKSFKKILKKNDGLYLPLKKNWLKIWKIRNKDPIQDAEHIKIHKNKILEIGEKIKDISETKYQYMGLIFIPKKFRLIVIKNYKLLRNKKKMHLTTFLNQLIKKNCPVFFKSTKEVWYEFDDYNDFVNFKKRI
jgi:L-glutamine-phosphate cytidylyltransferase